MKNKITPEQLLLKKKSMRVYILVELWTAWEMAKLACQLHSALSGILSCGKIELKLLTFKSHNAWINSLGIDMREDIQWVQFKSWGGGGVAVIFYRKKGTPAGGSEV